MLQKSLKYSVSCSLLVLCRMKIVIEACAIPNELSAQFMQRRNKAAIACCDSAENEVAAYILCSIEGEAASFVRKDEFVSQGGPMKKSGPRAPNVPHTKLFEQAARELGCDDDPAHFDESLKNSDSDIA